MKAKLLLLLWVFLSISIKSLAQFSCGTVQNSNNPSGASGTSIFNINSADHCTENYQPSAFHPSTGFQFVNHQMNLNMQSMGNSFLLPSKWLPDSLAQTKVIKLVMHVMHKGSVTDTTNFLESDSAHMYILRRLVVELNYRFSINDTSKRKFAGFPYIKDTKIQFELDTILFKPNCNGPNKYCFDCINNNDIINAEKMHFYICPDALDDQNGYDLFGRAFGIPHNIFSITNLWRQYQEDTDPAKWRVRGLGSQLAAHEIGHCLGLHHTWGNYDSMYPSIDFLQDVFGPPSVLPYVTHINSWTCDPYNTTTQTGNIRCSENIMSYNKDAGHMSGIQIGRMHRLLELTLYNLVKKGPAGRESLKINGIESWDGSSNHFLSNIDRDLELMPGAVLTLTGDFAFSYRTKIIVHKNAKLILNNATLSSFSGEQWVGIQLEGDANELQIPLSQSSHHGMLEMINSTIFNADNAISAWITGNWNSIGGLVIAKNSKFINNRRSVEFMKMNVANHSIFENCLFLIKNYPNVSNPFFGHVTIWGNKNIKFDNCKFINCDVTDELDLTKDKGIFSYDASYSVVNNCEFRNHSVGIHALDPNGAPFIANARFMNNGIGVKLIRAGSTIVRESEFTIGKKANGLTRLLKNTGIFNEMTTSYFYHDNVISGTDPNSENFGIFTRDGGQNANKIFRNNFDKVGTSIFYYEANRDPLNVWNGASFACNTFDSYQKDVRVEAVLNRAIDGIRTYQASNSNFESAGNKFTPSGVQFNIENQTINPINYYYGSLTNEQPLLYSPNVVVPVQGQTATLCFSPSYPYKYQGRLALKGQLDSLNQERKNLELTHRLLIDGGNTQQIQNEIGGAIPEDAWNLRSYLLGFAPNLSTETLLEAAYSGVLPTSFLMEVCLANPDATRSEDFLEILQNQIPIPISANLANLIRANWDDPTTRTVLELALARIRDLEQEQFTHYLAILQDDSVNRFNEIRDLLIQKGDQRDYFTLAMHYASVNGYHSAINILQTLPTTWLENAEFLKERNGYLSYFNLMKAIHDNGEKLPELSNERLNELRAFSAGNELEAQQHAKNILCFFYQECEGTEPQGRVVNYVRTKKAISAPAIQLFPNPCTDFVSISLGKNGNTSTQFQVFDMSGKNVYSGNIGQSGFVNLETKTWANGTYNIRISTTAGPMSLKFIKR